MSEILKTGAIVLGKLDYGDTSKIGSFFTEKYGKISAIIKGARSPKSKIGSIVDTLNQIDLVFYKKENRDLQFISQADLKNNFRKIKDDFEKLKHASAIIELVKYTTIEYEEHPKLYRGLVRILALINDEKENPKINFVKFFLFLLNEIGYDLQFKNCVWCGNEFVEDEYVFFNFESGFMCEECSQERLINMDFPAELFNLLNCLSYKSKQFSYNENDLHKLTAFLERYLSYHLPEFKKLKSLSL